jgi:hypothetical protein
MNKFLRMTSLAATVAAVAMTATPALAVGPSNANAKAWARIVKPLSLVSVRDLDLGTILLSGSGSWSGATVGISKAGVWDCANTNVTCSNAHQTAQYTITGTNNQDVKVTAGNVTLNEPVSNTNLTLTVDNPGTVNLGATGVKTFDLGGSISVASNTPDGTYSGTFDVTVDY